MQISLAGRALYEDLLRDLPVPFEFRADGGLIYFTTPEQGRVFEEFVVARRADGLDMELIDGAEVRRQVGPIRPDVLGASFCHNDAQINTPTVIAALAAGARSEGADVREGVEMTELIRDGDRVVGVETDRGRFMADVVVVATGAWTRKLLAANGIKAHVGIERLQVLATAPRPLDIRPVVYGPLAAKQYSLFRDLPSWNQDDFMAPYEIETGNFFLQLVSQRANGETLLGCPMDYPSDVTHDVTLIGLRDTAQAISDDFPGLRNVPIVRMWAGVLPYTSDQLPIVDEVEPGLFLAAGHIFGNAAGPMTGKLLSQMLAGRDTEIDMSGCRFDRVLQSVDPGDPVNW
jgi:glycine/D-amino acid oxidase-like deaminating enzyme